MGLYSKHIFPRVLDWSLGNALIQEQRREVLAPLSGHVLEIGFGTGLNLPFYPDRVIALTAIDSERMLPKRVAKRIAEARFPVNQLQLDAAQPLPFDHDAFDGVVTTFTLCSIPDVAFALSEIRRVLKADGPYVFLEHGRSEDPTVARRQDRFNPIQKFIARGCNLNRPIDRLIRDSGLSIRKLDRYQMPDTPRLLGEMYRGVASTS
ncbi:MAG TPA: class I SAM-dependent methyltransferase [Blastocatellia bacterium]|nr:class I SAM-dependent methyltransferase [Blastocatellia bacterium]